MGGNYEEVKKEIEEVIVKYMTSIPKGVSMKSDGESPISVEQSTPATTIVEAKDFQMENLSL